MTAGSEDVGLVNVTIISSANKPILCSYWPIFIPLISGFERIYSANGSIANEKIKGDDGHPCLVQFVKLNLLKIIPDVNNFAKGCV